MLNRPTTEESRSLAIAEPCWLYAQTVPLLGGLGLAIYRSTWIRATDLICRPVVEFVGNCAAELLIREVVTDKDMMHGKAVSALFRIGSEEYPVTEPYIPVHPMFAARLLAERVRHLN